MSARILIVDDESPIREMVGLALRHAGFECLEAADVAAARRQLLESQPDLVLLDWMLPGTSGVDFCRELRQSKPTKDLPVIMLTARVEEADRVRGLDTGADDYVTKPFSPRELISRIKALLRRSTPERADQMLKADSLSLDPVTHRVLANGTELALGPTEFRLLRFFMSRPERVHARAKILDSVWGGDVYVEERTVDVHIRRLRRALTATGHDELIQTVRGAGYRFSARQ
jgi:two-component system phosphate regulon response regulator PhoB